MYKAFQKWSKSNNWKYSVQVFEANLLLELLYLMNELQNHTYKEEETKPFVHKERDKIRYVIPKSVQDSVAQTSLCQNIMHPCIYPKLIYNNASSIKGGGVNLFRTELKNDLHNFWLKHGVDGYILLIDFRKFYDNIRHEDLIKMLFKVLPKDYTFQLVNQLIDNFSVDVSPLSDEEYELFKTDIFNSLEFHNEYGICKDREKILEKGIGIGSPISCDISLFYPHEIDNYCKIVRGLKYYGRFNDDIYIIHESKEYLEELLNDIRSIADKCGIFLNEKKTTITHLSEPFSILQSKYTLFENGKLIIEINTATIKREKRRLRKMREKLNNKEITIDRIYQDYQSWRGSIKKFTSVKKLMKMDDYFNKLFSNDVFLYKKRKRNYKKMKKVIRKRFINNVRMYEMRYDDE